MFLRLAAKSLLYRKGSVLLTIFAMSVSIIVMLGVEHVRLQAKTSFANSVSGVDLIVGARTGKLNLLLYSVFRMGAPTNNISWQSYQRLAENKAVSWSLPISLGDSHKGYRVLGTTPEYFDHFSYGSKQALAFDKGRGFDSVFEVVLGAKVAEALGYQLGDSITLSHGIGATSFSHHDQTPFSIVGILMPTGTPVDQTLHVSLQGLEAVHSANPAGILALKEGQALSLGEHKQLEPKSITAVMVGLKSRMMVFQLQRQINTDNSEPLVAILPGVALAELWQSMSVVENTLRLISLMVVVSALLGLSAMLLSSIKERHQEIKLLRMIGASPLFIYWFIELEALLITLVSSIIAIGILMLGLLLASDYLLHTYGLVITSNVLSVTGLKGLSLIFLFAFIAALPPALNAFVDAKN